MERELDLTTCNLFEKPKILSEITIQEPWQAEYLTEDRIIVNGRDGCSIINPITNKKIKKIDVVNAPHFTIHPTQKKIAFSGEKPAIYSSSGDLEILIPDTILYLPPVPKIIFDPLHNNILLENSSYYYDCKTGQKKRWNKYFSLVAFHPTQKLFYMYKNFDYAPNSYIEIYNTDTFQQTDTIMLKDSWNNPTHILCSPDGSLIAVQDKNKTIDIIKHNNNNTAQSRIKLPTINKQQFIMNPTTDTLTCIQKHLDAMPWTTPTTDMLFHPNSAVLATVMPLYIDRQPHQIVFYWDVTTQELITTMPPFPTYSHPCSHHYNKNIAFSPDGTKLIVVLPDKCVILPVPFEVRYNATEKFPSLFLFLLNQHDVPNDVKNIIVLNLLEAKFKR